MRFVFGACFFAVGVLVVLYTLSGLTERRVLGAIALSYGNGTAALIGRGYYPTFMPSNEPRIMLPEEKLAQAREAYAQSGDLLALQKGVEGALRDERI